jgi:hypothetical protein
MRIENCDWLCGTHRSTLSWNSGLEFPATVACGASGSLRAPSRLDSSSVRLHAYRSKRDVTEREHAEKRIREEPKPATMIGCNVQKRHGGEGRTSAAGSPRAPSLGGRGHHQPSASPRWALSSWHVHRPHQVVHSPQKSPTKDPTQDLTESFEQGLRFAVVCCLRTPQ